MSAEEPSSKTAVDPDEIKKDDDPKTPTGKPRKREQAVEFLRRRQKRFQVSPRSKHYKFRRSKDKRKVKSSEDKTDKPFKESILRSREGEEEDDSDTGTWIDELQSGDDSAKEKKERFKNALIKYLSEVNGTSPEHVWSNMTLENLLSKAKEVELNYKNSGKTRKAMRFFLKYSAEVASWLVVFPRTFPHSAIAFGGLKLLLEAAGRVGEGSADVFKILGEIPKALASVNVYVKLYKSSELIQAKSEEIYLVLIDVFEYALSWLFKAPAKKYAGALFKGKLYLGKLKGKLEKIKKVVKEVKEMATVQLHENIIELRKESLAQSRELQKLKLLVKGINSNSDKANRKADLQIEMLEKIANKVGNLRKGMSTVESDSEVGSIPLGGDNETWRLAERRAYSKESFEAFSSTIRTAFRTRHLTSSDREGLWNTILQSQEWEEWVNAGFGTLLVNANSNDITTPLVSFFAVKFVQSAMEEDIPVLHFSCNHIIDTKDPTPYNLIRSLTIQLCVYYDFDSEITSQMRRAMPNTTPELCRLFSDLVKQLPRRPVLLIVINGITHLESENWDETSFVVIELYKLAQCATRKIRLVITAQDQSTCVAGILQGECERGDDLENRGIGKWRGLAILNMPEENSLEQLDSEEAKLHTKIKGDSTISTVESTQAKAATQVLNPLLPVSQTWWPPQQLLFPPFAAIGFPGAGTTGLSNTQRTCYMNAVLQCMSGIVPLSRYFLEDSYKSHIQVYKTIPPRPAGLLTKAYVKTLRTIWRGNCEFFMPQTIRDAAIELRAVYKGKDQHDSTEFLDFFLSTLHEELNVNTPTEESNNLGGSQAGSQEDPAIQSPQTQWNEYLSKNNSVISQLFHGQLGSSVSCQRCKGASSTYSAFTHLALSIPSTKSSCLTFLDALEEFLREETLGQDVGWRCERCGTCQKATKKLTITRLPQVLVTQLKRVIFQRGKIIKNKTWVNIPLYIDLRDYIHISEEDEAVQQSTGGPAPSFLYDLYAICYHAGDVFRGHYTASIRRLDKPGWNTFNDRIVAPLDEKRLQSQSANLLFWVRRKVI